MTRQHQQQHNARRELRHAAAAASLRPVQTWVQTQVSIGPDGQLASLPERQRPYAAPVACYGQSNAVRIIVACLMACVGWSLEIPTTPYRFIREPQQDGSLQEWVDWGVAGPSRARYPEIIREDVTNLQNFLRSPEALAALGKLQGLAEAKSMDLIRAELARYKQDYESIEQPTRFPRSLQRSVDEVPIPRWAWGIPLEVRSRVQVLLFDDRDPYQRGWVVREGRREDLLTHAIMTGWKTGAERDAFWKATPGVPVQPVATDMITDYYQVTVYPARITFPEEGVMRIEQGCDPATLLGNP